MKQIVCALFAIFVLGSCRSRVSDGIISYTEKNCPDKACALTLKNITGFKWDKMYVFGSWTTTDSIGRIIGFKYHEGHDVPDDYTRMVFTIGKKIAHEEDFKSVDYGNSTIDFSDTLDSLSRTKGNYFTPGNSVFKISKYKTKGSCKTCYGYYLNR